MSLDTYDCRLIIDGLETDWLSLNVGKGRGPACAAESYASTHPDGEELFAEDSADPETIVEVRLLGATDTDKFNNVSYEVETIWRMEKC